MRTRAKVDRNQVEIVRALRELGASVQSLAPIGHGCPDLLVGYGQRTHLLELKAEQGDRLTPDEAAWLRDWAGAPVAVVRTVQGALAAVGVVMVEGR